MIYEGLTEGASKHLPSFSNLTSLTIAKHLRSFSNLTSLTIHIRDTDWDFHNRLAMISFRQRYPFLQRLYLYGNVSDEVSKITDDVYIFYFPSLLYIHVNRLHFILAIQIFDQCRQLRSFSAELCGAPRNDSPTASSILSATRFNLHLPAMKKLHLGTEEYFMNEFISTILELLLPCCPNLRTFSFNFVYLDCEKRPLDPNWWSRVFASNNKLKRISLQLHGNGIYSSLHKDVVQRFQLLPFFAQLNVNVTFTMETSEFLRRSHHYSIQN